MKIGIIGAGHIGGTLTRRLRALGHEVSVANSRGPDTLRDLERETGAHAARVEEVARDAELVVVTIPMKSVPKLPKDVLNGARPDVAVVDTCNYYPQRDGHIREIEDGMPSSRWTEKHLGHAVIKAFNNIQADHLMYRGKPKGESGRIALPISGDDAAARAKVMRLVEQLGFDPIDAGSLDESWRQEPGTPVYGSDRSAEAVRRGLQEAGASA